VQSSIGLLNNRGAKVLDHLALDQELAASWVWLGSDLARFRPPGDQFPNPAGRDEELLGDLFLGLFTRIHRGQDPHAQVDRVCHHAQHPTCVTN
jgi:hypothetical protein